MRTVKVWVICCGLLTGMGQVPAVDYADISGTILYEGTPLCAMALANGQYIFTCSGDGSYNLTVPLDANGEITQYSFASGFSPYKAVLSQAEAVDHVIEMQRAAEGSRIPWVEYSTATTEREGWVALSGSVHYLGTPLCTMTLANGQHMFTCGDNLGAFGMDVPVDERGEITLYVFVSGFQPWKEIFCGGVGVCQTGESTALPDTGQLQTYTDTFGEDSDYAGAQPSYNDNGDGTVDDNVTGLMWQQTDDDTTRTWSAAVTYCNDLTLAAYGDWRLPTRKELLRIIHRDAFDPAVDASIFPSTDSAEYWSATHGSGNLSAAWYVDFDSGVAGNIGKAEPYLVRCVRGREQTEQVFTDNGDGTVTDEFTKLMWQQEDDNVQRFWEDALSYCENFRQAGYTDWRLPNINELESICDETAYSPAIDEVAFPGTDDRTYYCSSTSDASSATDVWGVRPTSNCWLTNRPKTGQFVVRCVRDGQP